MFSVYGLVSHHTQQGSNFLFIILFPLIVYYPWHMNQGMQWPVDETHFPRAHFLLQGFSQKWRLISRMKQRFH